MRRIFFLSPDRASCQALVADIEALGVPESHIHVVAWGQGSLVGLPGAGVMTRTDVVRAGSRGALVGAVAGFLGGLLFFLLPPEGVEAQVGAMFWGALGGGVLGLVVPALLGREIPHHDIEAFSEALYRGQLLVLVDVSVNQVDCVTQKVMEHHPEVNVGVTMPPSKGRHVLSPDD